MKMKIQNNKISNKIIYLSMIFIFLIISSFNVNADSYGTFQINNPINLIQTCTTCSYVNITSVLSPSSEILIQDVSMAQTGSMYNYTLTSQTVIGTYIVCGVGDLDGDNTDWCYSFDVTVSGKENTSWLPLIISILFLTALFFGLMLWSKESMPFLANFMFMMLIWMITILTNILWRFSYEYGFVLQHFLSVFYYIMLIIASLMTFIILIILTVDAIQIRKIEGNPVDNFRDNLDGNKNK